MVLLAIRECIPSKLLLSADNSKVITIQLCAPKPVVLCADYLPPHSMLADAQPLFDHLSSVCSSTMSVIAIGDYNSLVLTGKPYLVIHLSVMYFVIWF